MKLEWWPRCQPWAMAKEGDLSVMSWNLLAPSKAEVGLLEAEVLIGSGDKQKGRSEEASHFFKKSMFE